MIISGVLTAIEIKCPYFGHLISMRFVVSAEKRRFTRRLPISMLIRIFCGSIISFAKDLLMLLPDDAYRCRSDFVREKSAVSDPEKNTERSARRRRSKKTVR
jgi:hypothetical protein